MAVRAWRAIGVLSSPLGPGLYSREVQQPQQLTMANSAHQLPLSNLYDPQRPILFELRIKRCGRGLRTMATPQAHQIERGITVQAAHPREASL